MPVNGAVINLGATVSATGGTAKTFSTTGQKVNGGQQVVDASNTDVKTRLSITVKSIPAQVGSDGQWTNSKAEVVVSQPKVLANGTQKFPNVRIILTDHPEMTQTEIDNLMGLAGQVCTDSDFQNLWRAKVTA